MILSTHLAPAQNKILFCSEAGNFALVTLYDTSSGSLVLIDQVYLSKHELWDNWGHYVRDVSEGYTPPEGETFFG